MPIGWLYGLSIALAYSGAIMSIKHSEPRPNQPVSAQLARQVMGVLGNLLFAIGLFTLIGTLMEQFVLS